MWQSPLHFCQLRAIEYLINGDKLINISACHGKNGFNNRKLISAKGKRELCRFNKNDANRSHVSDRGMDLEHIRHAINLYVCMYTLYEHVYFIITCIRLYAHACCMVVPFLR